MILLKVWLMWTEILEFKQTFGFRKQIFLPRATTSVFTVFLPLSALNKIAIVINHIQKSV